MPDFPRHHLALLQDLGARLLDSRKAGTDLEHLARDLLAGFEDACIRTGLDALPDEVGLADDAQRVPALVAQLRAADLDGGGPRNARPRQLAEAVVAALGLTLVDEPDRTITLDDTVRAEVTAAIASVIDAEIVLPRLRDAIIAKGRELCEEQYQRAYELCAAQLDERGLRLNKQPKIPLDALHAVQRVLADARDAVIGQAAWRAIDRAKQVLERASAEAAARIDAPVTHKLTPREVAIFRACDPRLAKQPPTIIATLLEGLCDMARITWRAPELPVRPYAASQKFAVGDLIEHPKFGRGSVVSVMGQRMDVEFSDGKHTLVHGK